MASNLSRQKQITKKLLLRLHERVLAEEIRQLQRERAEVRERIRLARGAGILKIR